MDTKKIVFHETAIAAIGEIICTAAMIGMFALLGNFDSSVLLGGIVGAIIATGNFFFMAVSANLAADKAEQQDIHGGQQLIRNSYILRLVGLFVILFACCKSGLFNLFALVLPLVFLRPALTVAELFRKKGSV